MVGSEVLLFKSYNLVQMSENLSLKFNMWPGLKATDIMKFFPTGSVLSTLVSFDREERKEYMLPVSIIDSGTPRLTGVSMLHIIIGDRNDNAMEPGNSNIFIYNYKVLFVFILFNLKSCLS